MKLLLIKDNEAMRTTLKRSFERLGMQLVACGDGTRAGPLASQPARRGAAGPEPAGSGWAVGPQQRALGGTERAGPDPDRTRHGRRPRQRCGLLQWRGAGPARPRTRAATARGVALDLSALIADRQLDFSIDSQPAPVRSHEWALRELTRDLLHNAAKHCPVQGGPHVRLHCDATSAALTVADSGPGIADTQRERLFQPFSAGLGGSGLGLAICHDIVASLGGRIELVNRLQQGRVAGLDAVVRLPLAENRA